MLRVQHVITGQVLSNFHQIYRQGSNDLLLKSSPQIQAMEDQVCPRCKTSRYRNPSLKLMVNACGHTLCENCVELLFIKGSGSCPECRVPLKRSNFRLQLFEDAGVEKEVDIRKKILKDYNRKEEDFNTLEEYNDYLEEVETIIYNLSNNIDVAEMTQKVELYRKQNKESIMRNKMKYSKEASELDRLIEEERMLQHGKREALEKEEMEMKRRKIIEKEALIDELMFSDTNAKEILNYFAETKTQAKMKTESETGDIQKEAPKKVSYFSTGVKIGDSRQMFSQPLPKIEEGPLYVYEEPTVITDGPPYPTWENLEELGYLEHVRQETTDEKAGGFHASLACMRALQEGMLGLYNTAIKFENSS